MVESRTGYVLTCNQNSPRTQFSKNVLEKVGFNVILFDCIPHENKVLSNKISMMAIYQIIADGNGEWGYVFEDDINILQDINLNEIIEYEKISSKFFYLGACIPYQANRELNCNKIDNHEVSIISGNVRGLHAIGISKEGAKELLSFCKDFTNWEYMDMILEKFSEKNPANIIRYDLESYIHGHRGIFFQDRDRFPSII